MKEHWILLHYIEGPRIEDVQETEIIAENFSDAAFQAVQICEAGPGKPATVPSVLCRKAVMSALGLIPQ